MWRRIITESTSGALQQASAGPASRGVIEPQFSTQALFFDAERKQLLAVATAEIFG